MVSKFGASTLVEQPTSRFGDVSILAPQTIEEAPIDMLAQAPIEDTALSTIEAGIRGFGQGATLGFSDEAQAALGAAFVKVAENFPEVLGGIEPTGKGFGDLFKEGKALVRGREKELAKLSPVTSTLAEIAGGVITGGTGLAKTAALKGVKGVTATLAGAGVLGATAGAGFSEAQEVDKIVEDALAGAVIGVGTAGILTGATRVGAPLVKKTINSILRSNNPNKFTQAEQFIQAKIKDGSAPELLRDIERAERGGVSTPLAAVVGDSSLGRTASSVAQNVQTEDIANLGIQKLSNTLARTERNILNDVAKKVTSAQEGADVFRQGITSLKNGLIEARRLKSVPLYEKSVQAGNRLRPAVVESLRAFKTKTGTTNPAIGNTIDELRRTGQFVDLPDNSMPVLDATFKKLGAAARATQDSFEKSTFLEAQKKLRGAIAQKFPTYEKAVQTFSDESGVLNELTRKKNPLATLIGAEDVNAVQSVQKIFNQQPQLIAQTRSLAVKNGLEDAFDAGAKSNILEKISRRPEGTSFTSVFRGTKAREQLIASVGRDKANAFQEVMKGLDEFTKFKRGLGGSQTQPLLQAEQEIATAAQGKFRRGVGKIGQISQGAKNILSPSNKTFDDFANAANSERFRQEIANILFDRKTGKAFLNKINKSDNPQKSVGQFLSTALDRFRAFEPELQRQVTGSAIVTGVGMNGDISAPRILREGENVR